MTTFNIISNCNFESRDDVHGLIIYRAMKAAEQNLVARIGSVATALQNLDEVLSEYAEQEDMQSIQLCEAAETEVVEAWGEIADDFESSHFWKGNHWTRL